MIINKYGVAFFVLVLLFTSCKNEGCNIVLNTISFNTTLNPNQSSKVKVSNGWTYAEGGNCGIIVYNTGSLLIAYDRCMPGSVNPLEVDGLQVIDKVSGEKWLLLDGSPTHLSECSLKRYHVETKGEFIFVKN